MPVLGVRRSLWRAVAVYRVVTLLICLALIGSRWDDYSRPWVAALVGAGMAVVTAVVGYLAITGRADRAAVVIGDLIATVGLTLATIGALTPTQLHAGAATLTTIWAAGPVLEAGLLFGWVGGLASACAQAAAAAIVGGRVGPRTIDSAMILLVAGAIAGYVSRLAIKAEVALAEAERTQAALAERERLAGGIHDGVLQVLALVHRSGRDEPEPWAQLAVAAGEQEAALRSLLSSPPRPAGNGSRDVAAGLRSLATDRVTVSTGADAVLLEASVAVALEAAVGAALHNVARHAGTDARAWVLLEDLGSQVQVIVRDDGAGFAAERLQAATEDGRLGVAVSIRARIERLGGQVSIESAAGVGTTIKLLVPRVPR